MFDTVGPHARDGISAQRCGTAGHGGGGAAAGGPQAVAMMQLCGKVNLSHCPCTILKSLMQLWAD